MEVRSSTSDTSYALVVSKPVSTVGSLTTLQSFLISGTESQFEYDVLENSLNISLSPDVKKSNKSKKNDDKSVSEIWKNEINDRGVKAMIEEFEIMRMERVARGVFRAWYQFTTEAVTDRKLVKMRKHEIQRRIAHQSASKDFNAIRRTFQDWVRVVKFVREDMKANDNGEKNEPNDKGKKNEPLDVVLAIPNGV